MNDMTLRRPVNSKPPNASKLNPPNDPHPRTPNVKSTANCGDFPRGEFPEDVLKKDGSASLITGNTMGSPEMARFVGLMRLCEARGRFSKCISCCISLPGLAESSYPSQGCALTGRPCTQKRTQLGRQKPAVQQWSQRQSRPELVDIQPTPGPECLFGAIGKETYSAPLAIARALFRLFQSSAVERSHYFGVQPNPSSVKKQVKFAVFSNQEFRCSPAEPDVCTAPRRGRPRS